MDVFRKEELHTIEDIYALPDGERAELIEGCLYALAMPGRTHQKISWKLHQAITNYIEENHDSCEVYAAPFAVFLKADGINYLEPDISVICDLSKLDEDGCHGAPDWVIEIVSKSSKPRDYMIKMVQYRAAGVREYWIVDPEKETIMVYGFERDFVEQYRFDEDVPVGIYERFQINMKAICALL